MARYEVELSDETIIEADDARFLCDGKFVELLPRKAASIEGEPATIVINSSQVVAIEHKKIGFSGGYRFSGDKDSSFARTVGSI
jgi:hypothetical protein